MNDILGFFPMVLIGVVVIGAAVITAGLEFAEWLQRRFVRRPRRDYDGFAQTRMDDDGSPVDLGDWPFGKKEDKQ